MLDSVTLLLGVGQHRIGGDGGCQLRFLLGNRLVCVLKALVLLRQVALNLRTLTHHRLHFCFQGRQFADERLGDGGFHG